MMGPREIVARVAEANGLSLADLTGKCSARRRAWARQEAMLVLRQTTSLSTTGIGRVLNRHHSTVLYGLRQVEDRMKRSPTYVGKVADLIVEVMEARAK